MVSSHDHVRKFLGDIFNLAAPEENDFNLSVYISGHDRAAVVSKGNKVLEVIEAERLLNFKNGDWGSGKITRNYPTNSYEFATFDLADFYTQQIFDYVIKKYSGVVFKNCIGVCTSERVVRHYGVKFKNFIEAHHHSSHAFGAFFQSPYRQALVLTYDGGSPDHIKTAGFLMTRGKKPIFLGASFDTVVGRYQDLGLLFECFEWQPAKAGLVLPGKIMALASFGKPNKELLPYYKSLCSAQIHPDIEFLKEEFKNFDPDEYITTREMKKLMDKEVYGDPIFTKEGVQHIFINICKRLFITTKLLEKEGISNAKELAPLAMAASGINYLKYFSKYNEEDFKRVKRIPNEKAFDMAATLQLACEESFFEKTKVYLDAYPNIPIVLTGGGALNIVLNSRIKKDTGRLVFVGPDPSDCGLALGAMLGYLKPSTPYFNPYTGLPILDIDCLGAMVMEHVGTNSELSKYIFVSDIRYDISYVVKLIIDGKILGVIRNNSERGPRALGNRSIICSASLPHIKDTLNAKVKFREWFRPFAPIVRQEDVNKYFDWEGESRYMNFCIDVREEYREKLQAITHVDGTARVQTITEQQNPFIHRILSDLDKETGTGVMVNTSFNVNGRPLINSVKDAFYMLEKTELDGIIVQNTLILKK